MPHGPYRYLPSGRQYEARNFLRVEGEKTTEPWPWLNARHRLLLQTAYTDRLLGEVLDRLEATDLYDRSLVVVTADHGISRVPGLERSSKSVGPENAHEAAWVPLFVKAPGQVEGEVRDDNANLSDLLPTMADLLGVEVPWPTDGIVLHDERRSSHEKVFFNSVGDEPVRFDDRDHLDRVLDGLTDRLVDPAGGDLGLYAFGPHADLVGTSLSDLAVSEGDGAVALDGVDDYDNVDPHGPTVPAIVSGRLDAFSGESVAIAVNGVIGGSSAAFRGHDDERRFVTMVPPSLFRDGSNRVDVFAVETDGDRARLRRLRQRS